MLYRRFASQALFVVLLATTTTSGAEWLAPRADSRNSGVVQGEGPEDPARTLIWRLPFGFASDSGSVIAPQTRTPLTVVRNGVVQSFGADGSLLSTSAPLGIDALIGWLQTPLADGTPALVTLRTGRDVAVFDRNGSLVALSSRVDPAFGPSAAFTLLGTGSSSVVTAPASTLSIFAWGPPDTTGLEVPSWQQRFEGAPPSLRFVFGDFVGPGSNNLVGLDTGTVSTLNAETGEVVAYPPAFFTTAGTGFSHVVDIDDDGVDELAIAHTTANGYARVGVMTPVAGAFVWWLEYLNPARTTQLAAVRESIADLDGDGAFELIVSVFDSQDFETTRFPAGPLSDLDGTDTPSRWTTLIFDLATGEVRQRISDRIVRGVLQTDSTPVLMLTDTTSASALTLATLELARLERSADVVVLERLSSTDVARAPIAIERDRHNPRDPTALLGDTGQTVVVVRDPLSGLPLRYDRLQVSGETVEVTPLAEASGGEVAPIRAEVGGGSVWITPDGLQVRDAALNEIGVPVPGPGRTTTLRVARDRETTGVVRFAFRGAQANVLAFERATSLALPEPTFAAADLFNGQLYGVFAGDSLYWAVRVGGVDGLDGIAFIDANTGDYERRALEVAPDPTNGIAAAESLGLVAMTWVDNREAGAARFRMSIFDASEPGVIPDSWPLNLERAPLTPPMAWVHEGEARFAASTFGAIRVYDADGNVLLAINNEGQNRPLLGADVTGDGVVDIVAGAVAPTAGAPRRFCAWDGVSGARLWCEDDASAAASPNAVVGELPVEDSVRSDVLLAYPDGEVRRVDAASGNVLWRICLDAGGVTLLGATDEDARCQGARITAPVVANIDSSPEREMVFGSADGFVYTLNVDGTAVTVEDLDAGVAQLAVADVDGDGFLDVLVSLATGEVAALAVPRIAAPEGVVDVAIDAITDEPGFDDIDETNERDRVGVRWNANPEAGGWRVAVVNEEGVEVGFTSANAADTAVIVERVPLVLGVRYESVVEAISAIDGTSSIASRSDGFVVADLIDPPDTGIDDVGLDDVGLDDVGLDDVGLDDTTDSDIGVDDVVEDDTLDAGSFDADTFEDETLDGLTAPDAGDAGEDPGLEVSIDVTPLPGEGCSCGAAGLAPGQSVFAAFTLALLLLLRRRSYGTRSAL